MPGLQGRLLAFVFWGAQSSLEWGTEQFRRTRALGVWWAPCNNHQILDLSFAQPQTGRVGEGKGWDRTGRTPCCLGGWSSGMHTLCGGVGLSAILADAGRSRSGYCPVPAPPP